MKYISNNDLLYLLENNTDCTIDKDVYTSEVRQYDDLKDKSIYCNGKLIVSISQGHYGVNIRDVDRFPELTKLIGTAYYIHNDEFGKVKFLKLYCKFKEDKMKWLIK